MDLQTFVTQARKAASPVQLFHCLEKAANQAGLDYMAYAALKDHGRYGSKHRAPAVIVTYPANWIAHYSARNYQKIDPVLLHTTGIGVPYLWRWLEKLRPLDEAQHRLFREAEEAGLRQGLTVPLVGLHGTASLLSLATASNEPILEHHLGRLGLYAAIFHASYVDMTSVARHQTPPEMLTTREKDCLRWIIAGKSSFEIGVILGISEHTVRSYTKTIFRKLNVSNRTMAAARAMQLGLLDD